MVCCPASKMQDDTSAILHKTDVMIPEREPEAGESMEPKQAIVMRRDLGMRRRKEIAEGAHASMMWLSHRIRKPGFLFTEAEQIWDVRGDSGIRVRYSSTVKVALRTEKESSPEKTRWIVLPSLLIHFVGKLHVSPGPTSQSSVKNADVHGPHGSGAS
jgi:peptidyl-tRNA hydrolase